MGGRAGGHAGSGCYPGGARRPAWGERARQWCPHSCSKATSFRLRGARSGVRGANPRLPAMGGGAVGRSLADP